MNRIRSRGRVGRRAGARENPRERKRNPTGDEVTAHELALYAVNNAELYRSRIVPVIANLRRKIKRGIYDENLALKLWKYAADDAAKRYTYETDRSGARSHWEVKGYGIFTVPIRVAAAREIKEHYTSEVFELRANPAQRIRSTRRRARLGLQRLRGHDRVEMEGETLDDPSFYKVQVWRTNRWITLAGFTRDAYGKARATEYGKMLAQRYPRQRFQVFWPDNIPRKPKVNPRGRAASWYIGKKPDGTYTFKQTAHPTRENWLEVYGPFSSRDDASVALKHLKGYTRRAKGDYARYRAGKPPRKNPAPRVRADGAEVERAARLFSQFTGHSVTRARQVNLPRPKVGLAIGPVLGISYATTRDGKRENYLHEFRRGARPLLAASQDGRTLLLLSGAYRFTPRGIVDTPRR